MRTFQVLLLALQLVATATYGQSTVDHFSAVVAYLYSEHPQIVERNNTKYELWLKSIASDTLIQERRVATGTGFFVADSSHLYLITAEHVAAQMTPSGRVTLKTANDRPISFSFSQFTQSRTLKWTVNPRADVAVLPLNPVAEIWPHLKRHFLEPTQLLDSLVAPSRDRPVVTIGFPLSLGLQERFSPISQESKPGSGLLSLPRFDTKVVATFFLLDSPSVGGFSGAPVFTFPGAYNSSGSFIVGGTTACVGLVHGTISDDTGGKFAAIVPAALIIETIDLVRNAKK